MHRQHDCTANMNLMVLFTAKKLFTFKLIQPPSFHFLAITENSNKILESWKQFW